MKKDKSKPDPPGNEATGRTVWDIVWDFSRNRRGIAIAICVLAAATFAAQRLGWLEIQWNHGISISIARPLPADVAKRLVGSWHGTGRDTSSSAQSSSYQYLLNFHFKTDGRTVVLDGDYDIQGETLPRRSIRGSGEIRDDYVRLTYEYHAIDHEGTVGYGVMLLHIPPNGSSITGRFVARAMQDDTIKTGSLELTRSN